MKTEGALLWRVRRPVNTATAEGPPVTIPILILLSFQLAGEVAARALGLPLPGPVIGLAGLFALLVLRPRVADRVRPAAAGLLSHLSLLFVPAGVGIVGHLATLRADGAAIAVALVGSTILAMAVAALVFRGVARATGG